MKLCSNYNYKTIWQNQILECFQVSTSVNIYCTWKEFWKYTSSCSQLFYEKADIEISKNLLEHGPVSECLLRRVKGLLLYFKNDSDSGVLC